MEQLNLPSYNFRIKDEGSKRYIFDNIRKKFVVLTSEEWVRQNFMQYLIQEKSYPESLIVAEKKILLNDKPFRFDLLVYNRNGEPYLIAEIKAPHVRITQEVFDQVVRYNMALRVKLVVVSNGIDHFVCEVDYAERSYKYLKEVPSFR
jgi:hypothetical protein